jgi:hypothetical protein
MENKTEVAKHFNLVKAIPKIEKIEDSMRLGQLFIDSQLLVPLERDPRKPEEAKKKWPKNLVPARPDLRKFGEKGFYTWNIPKPKGKLAFFLFIGIIIAIAFMLFNLWPLWLKIGIWYFSFYTLILLVNIQHFYFTLGWLYPFASLCLAFPIPFRSRFLDLPKFLHRLGNIIYS